MADYKNFLKEGGLMSAGTGLIAYGLGQGSFKEKALFSGIGVALIGIKYADKWLVGQE